jgi:Transposase DDE domain.
VAWLVVGNVHGKWSHVRVIWADGGDVGQVVEWAQHVGGWTLDSSKRFTGVSHFQVAPKRWVVERTFAWLGKYRRLRKDDEARTATSEAFIYVAMTPVMVRRLAHIHVNDSS